MESAWAIGIGLLLGILGSLPPAVLFERVLKEERPASVVSGMVSILGSFVLLSGAVLVVYAASRQSVLVFGVSMVASFMLVWAIEAWRGWRAAQVATSLVERKRGESSR